MKFLSWNVNGLRALLRVGGLSPIISATEPNIVCIQETKADECIDLGLPSYSEEWNFPARRGYAGTLCLCKKPPQSASRGLGIEELDCEGRVITLEYPSFYLVNVYIPQSQGGLERWYYRLDFDAAFAEHAERLIKKKPVVIGGDFNVAHGYTDIYPENTRNFEHTPGFKEEERGSFDNLLSLGYVDSFRLLHPNDSVYTWWGKRFEHRAKNRGRRLDYFLVSENIADLVISSEIISEFEGSDHAPISMEVRL